MERLQIIEETLNTLSEKVNHMITNDCSSNIEKLINIISFHKQFLDIQQKTIEHIQEEYSKTFHHLLTRIENIENENRLLREEFETHTHDKLKADYLVKYIYGRGPNDEKYGVIPFYKAIIDRNIYEIKLMIEANADVNMKDKQNRTPLYYAIESNNTEIIELLLKAGADVNIKDKAKRKIKELFQNKKI